MNPGKAPRPSWASGYGVVVVVALLIVLWFVMGGPAPERETGSSATPALDSGPALPPDVLASTSDAGRLVSSKQESALLERESYLVQVFRRGGGPVADALIEVGTEKSLVVPAGHTDQSGAARVQINGRMALLVSARGFVTHSALIDSSANPGSCRVELEPAVSVTVEVVLESGMPAPSGIRLVAWILGGGESPTSIARGALTATSASLAAATDDRGIAVIEGISPTHEYRISAGGHGYSSRGDRREPRGGVLIPPGATEARLVVYCAYGLELLLVDASTGSPAEVSHASWGAPVFTTMLDSAATQCLPDSVESLLCGITPAEARPTLAHQAFLFTSAQCEGEIGPFQVRLALAGYEQVEVSRMIPRLTDSPTRLVVKVQPLGGGFGDIIFRFHQGAAFSETRSSGSVLPDAFLHLSNGNGFEQKYAVKSMIGEARVDSIPYGQYRMTIVSLNGAFRWPASSDAAALVVVSDKPEVVTIDLSTFSTLRLEILDVDGRLYTGILQLELLRNDEPRVPHILQAKDCPCVFQGFRGGSYSLRALAPFSPNYESARVQHVDLSDGVVTDVQILRP